MLKTLKVNNFTWIDIKHPDTNDIEFLRYNFALKPTVLNKIIPPLKRSETEQYENYIFIILHFPIYNSKKRQNHSSELDVIVMRDVIITSHNGDFSEVEKFFDCCKEGDCFKYKYLGKGTSHLFYHLIDTLIDARLSMLDHISENIAKIEEDMFQGREKELLYEISIAKRDIIDFRSIVKPQRSVLEAAGKRLRTLSPLLDHERHLEEVIGSNIKVWNTLENQKEMIEAIETSNETLLSYKLNETMKILTIVSVIFTPMALVVNIWGMGFENIPLASNPIGFWIILLLSFLSGVVFMLYFKKKKWL